MFNLNDELARECLAECREHLSTLETDLLALQKGTADFDEELLDGASRAAHALTNGAGFLELPNVRELARETETALALIRSSHMAAGAGRVQVLLRATDRLYNLIESPATRSKSGGA